MKTAKPPDPAPRTRLNRERVLQAAVVFADQHGLEALNMRDLAAELQVVPMAIYKHVANKEDLLDGMVDALVREIESPPPETSWKSSVRQMVLSARNAILRHETWARRAIESRPRRSQTVLAHMDRMAGAFRGSGFSDDLTHHVMHTLGNRMWGFSPELFNDATAETHEPVDSAVMKEALREAAARYPNIFAITHSATGGDESLLGRGCDEQFEFEFALDLLLDGFERLHQQGWKKPRRRTLTRSTTAKAGQV
jgi:AcrR family transcriptional regulator